MRRMPVLLALAAILSCCAFGVARADGNGTVNIELNPEFSVKLPSDPNGAMRNAREMVAAGNLNGAIEALATYVAGHPGQAGPERLLGDLYYRRGELKMAEQTYRNILLYAPLDKETHARLGSVYATENHINEAIAEFDRSLPGTDSVPDLVQLHLRKGDFKQYEHERQMAAQEFPSDSDAQLELGQVYEAIHQPLLAMRYFQRALDDDPASLLAMNGLGMTYMDEQQWKNAISMFDQCLTRDTYNYACADNLGATYLEDGSYALALPALDRAHQIAPERAEALVNLGYLADVHGDWKKAVSLYVQAMTVYPYSPDAYIDLGYTYNMHGLYGLAQAALIKGLAVAPLDGRLHFLLGDAYEHQGNNAMAEKQFEAAAANNDLDPDVQRLAQERVAALRVPHPKSKP